MSTLPKHSVSVAGIILDARRRVLLIRRRDNGRWEPPGGVLELDEGFESGVRREVHEETGVTIEVDRLTGVYKNMSLGVVSLVFRCRAVAGDPRPSDEAALAEWVDLEAALARLDEVRAVRVSDALADIPTVREHDGVRLIGQQRRGAIPDP